jgi:UDP-N-acetylglucosamine 4,6-dehydratase/5-epimerase
MDEKIEGYYRGKDILITGGCGSIGSEIVRRLLPLRPRLIRVFDNNESGQFHLHQELQSYDNVRYLMGDIRDKERLKLALRGVNIIFHAAAMKHVPLCEYNPYESVLSNVIGTQNLIEVARDLGIDVFIGISTDKVVHPINTMGAAKLLAEKLIINGSLGDYESKYNYKTRFSCVRFGNVLNSRGSVIPTFKSQIANGGPITLTHPDMTRFFMSTADAVSLVLKAGAITQGREIFIIKMKKLKIKDLAEGLIRHFAPVYGYSPENINVEVTGTRPGEKLHELLMGAEESVNVVRNDDMIVVKPSFISPTYSEPDLGKDTWRYTSEEGPHLTTEEILQLLHSSGSLR